MARLILFVCTYNADRSVMAEAFFNRYNRDTKWRARSAGTSPKASVNPVVVQAMKEKDIDVSAHVPHMLTVADAAAAERIVTMGCIEGCPLTPPDKTVDWKLRDPAGLPLQDVRTIRDDVERRVRALLHELDKASIETI